MQWCQRLAGSKVAVSSKNRLSVAAKIFCSDLGRQKSSPTAALRPQAAFAPVEAVDSAGKNGQPIPRDRQDSQSLPKVPALRKPETVRLEVATHQEKRTSLKERIGFTVSI